jgi:hypothetical protein
VGPLPHPSTETQSRVQSSRSTPFDSFVSVLALHSAPDRCCGRDWATRKGAAAHHVLKSAAPTRCDNGGAAAAPLLHPTLLLEDGERLVSTVHGNVFSSPVFSSRDPIPSQRCIRFIIRPVIRPLVQEDPRTIPCLLTWLRVHAPHCGARLIKLCGVETRVHGPLHTYTGVSIVFAPSSAFVFGRWSHLSVCSLPEGSRPWVEGTVSVTALEARRSIVPLPSHA